MHIGGGHAARLAGSKFRVAVAGVDWHLRRRRITGLRTLAC